MFQFGPAEWIWRSLTYSKRQPLPKLVIETARLCSMVKLYIKNLTI
ncbi:hypothetical protein MOF42_18230 [Bacillus haynesii]|nr:hypothetical protein [Bacillus haynesii]MCY8019220.1 hypothetical protein [Bacillus haynesii]MCY8586761.1 hypothetical protein [Bacillus haynesii]MCY8618393.1 hypothetical protein [Bacillus haynesii]MCY8678063.1 hypothetical protein [Bacillus haynesii]